MLSIKCLKLHVPHYERQRKLIVNIFCVLARRYTPLATNMNKYILKHVRARQRKKSIDCNGIIRLEFAECQAPGIKHSEQCFQLKLHSFSLVNNFAKICNEIIGNIVYFIQLHGFRGMAATQFATNFAIIRDFSAIFFFTSDVITWKFSTRRT